MSVTLFLSLILAFAFSELSFAYEDATILPKGVYRPKVVGVQTAAVSEQFDSNGNAVSYVQPLNQKLSTADFAKKNPALAGVVQGLQGLEKAKMVKAGASASLLNAELASQFESQTRSMIPVLEYGLTNKVSIGIRVPIVARSVKTSLSAQGVNNAGLYAPAAKSIPTKEAQMLVAGLEQISTMNLNTGFFERSIFTDHGYDAPADFDKTELGDIEFGGKYQFYNKGRYRSAALAGVRVPTGSTPSLTNIYDTGSGNGNVALGVQGFQDVLIGKHVIFSGNVMGQYYFQDSRQRAVPTGSLDTLPDLRPEQGQVQNVKRRQSPRLSSAVYSKFVFWNERINFWGGYELAYKGEDKFSGPGNLAYSILEDNSDFTQHAADLGIGYSSISDFRNKKMRLPMEASVSYNQTFAGHNMPKLSYVRMDMNVYF